MEKVDTKKQFQLKSENVASLLVFLLAVSDVDEAGVQGSIILCVVNLLST